MITVEKPSVDTLLELEVDTWPVWEKEASEFPWEYDQKETCYILEGDVTVTPEKGDPVSFGRGDMVVFDKGLKCRWKINKAVRKHYRFG